ncbi:MAG: helix-turn-helix domain-containing protein [Xanthobacteraceae bacterium]
MPSRSTPLSNYPVLHSRDPELVRDRLFKGFGATRLDVTAGQDKFAARVNHLQISGLGLSYCDYVGDVSLGFGGASFVRQIFNISGTGRYEAGGPPGEITPGSWSSILPAHTPLNLEVKSGYRQLVLRIEVDALVRNLGALLGQEITGKLEFENTFYPPAMSSLRRRVFLFASEFNERGAYFSDLVSAEVERMMIMNFLMCHRHNYSHLLLRQPLPSSLSAVRAVEEFIEANWDKPIDILTMTSVAKVSARSLFRQFKKDRGYSPADFAKRIRLNHAREMLEQSGGAASVTQIALKCGFQNPGHFARDFRLAFGELPSELLRKSIRRPS